MNFGVVEALNSAMAKPTEELHQRLDRIADLLEAQNALLVKQVELLERVARHTAPARPAVKRANQ